MVYKKREPLSTLIQAVFALPIHLLLASMHIILLSAHLYINLYTYVFEVSYLSYLPKDAGE